MNASPEWGRKGTGRFWEAVCGKSPLSFRPKADATGCWVLRMWTLSVTSRISTTRYCLWDRRPICGIYRAYFAGLASYRRSMIFFTPAYWSSCCIIWARVKAFLSAATISSRDGSEVSTSSPSLRAYSKRLLM